MEPTLGTHSGPNGPRGAELADSALAEREALRIQAAAVIAQQAALTEEEARLEQRRALLAEQEAQLAAHLAEQRRELLESAAQARAEREALAVQRDALDRHAEAVRAELDQARREIFQGQQEVQVGRTHLAALARRMKQRWHRSWRAEREAQRHRAETLNTERLAVERAREQLEAQRSELASAWLRSNGEFELGRRKLQAAWDELRATHARWEQQRACEISSLKDSKRALDRRAAALADGERELADERHRWGRKLARLRQEADGLEARALNHRRKLDELRRELACVEQRLVAARAVAGIDDGTVSAESQETNGRVALDNAARGDTLLRAETRAASPEALAQVALAQGLAVRTARVEEAEGLGRRQAEALERFADELADQRLHLVELCERVAAVHLDWHREREAALVEVEALAARLPERERELDGRERSLDAAEIDLRRRYHEALQLREHIEGWCARLKARETGWESERDRLLLELRGREQLAARHLEATARLRQRWAARRRDEIEAGRAERTACERLRRECAALREELIRRLGRVEEQRRILAEKALALEQYRQQHVIAAADAAAADRRIERLCKQWQTVNAAAIRTAEASRAALRTELTRLEERQAALHRHMEDLAVREAQLAARQTQWEESQALTEAEQARARQELVCLQGQRDRYALHLRELQDEIERIARMLLEESQPAALDAPQAA